MVIDVITFFQVYISVDMIINIIISTLIYGDEDWALKLKHLSRIQEVEIYFVKSLCRSRQEGGVAFVWMDNLVINTVIYSNLHFINLHYASLQGT